MKSVVNENELPEKRPSKAAETPVTRLEVSWQVAPAQKVAILDYSDEAADYGLSPMPTGEISPDAAARAA